MKEMFIKLCVPEKAMSDLDDQLKKALEEIKKPEVIERIMRELKLKLEQQQDCYRTTHHRNQQRFGLNYTRWRVHYVCNDCGAVGNRPLNKNEADKYYYLMRTPITI